MSDPVAPLVPQTFWQRLAHQAEITFRSGSTYVVIALGILVGVYNAMSASQQATLLGAFPFLQGWGGVVTAVMVFLGTRIKPSTALSSQTQALFDEIARLKLNQFLQSKGQQPIAAPPAPPTPDPAPTPAPAPIAPPSPVPAPPPAAPVQDLSMAPKSILIQTADAIGAHLLKMGDPQLDQVQLELALQTLRSSRRPPDVVLP